VRPASVEEVRRPGGEKGRPARIRLGSWGCLIPCRKAVLHDVLLLCICTHIYRYNVCHHVLNYTKKEGTIRKEIIHNNTPENIPKHNPQQDCL
jgi:hypothetical protein